MHNTSQTTFSRNKQGDNALTYAATDKADFAVCGKMPTAALLPVIRAQNDTTTAAAAAAAAATTTTTIHHSQERTFQTQPH